MRKLRLRGEMTCPRSHSLVSGGISGRITSPATYSSASSGEVVGSSLVLRLKWSLQLCGQRHFREREMKCPPSARAVASPPRWCRLSHQRVWLELSEASPSGHETWWALSHSLRTVHPPQARSQMSIFWASQQQSPALKPAKKTGPVPSTWCYKSANDFKTQVSRFQCYSGFSSCFLYNR